MKDAETRGRSIAERPPVGLDFQHEHSASGTEQIGTAPNCFRPDHLRLKDLFVAEGMVAGSARRHENANRARTLSFRPSFLLPLEPSTPRTLEALNP